MRDAYRLFNTEDHRDNLERMLIHSNLLRGSNDQLMSDNGSTFMVLCQRCRLYFNEFKNEKEMLCLHHPGVSREVLLLISCHTLFVPFSARHTAATVIVVHRSVAVGAIHRDINLQWAVSILIIRKIPMHLHAEQEPLNCRTGG